MEKRKKNYYCVIILNVEQCYCFDLGFLPVLFKKNNNNNNNNKNIRKYKRDKSIMASILNYAEYMHFSFVIYCQFLASYRRFDFDPKWLEGFIRYLLYFRCKPTPFTLLSSKNLHFSKGVNPSFCPHPGGFDSSRFPIPGNLPSKAKKNANARGSARGSARGVLGAGNWLMHKTPDVIM